MAGITGIVKKNNNSQIDLDSSIASMMNKLAYSQVQLKQTYITNSIAFGNAVPISAKTNDHFIHNKQFDLFVAIDGLVFISDEIRNNLSKDFELIGANNDYELIPYLFHRYKTDFMKYITGWFNIFLYDRMNETCLLINDPLGYLPLYFYENNDFLIFASKIECILSSRLMGKIEFDSVTIAEHLFFNYPLSDHTYLINISTFSNGECIIINRSGIERKKYWSISELFNYKPLSEKESLYSINEGLKNALNKVNALNKSKLNISLTGGWDSRVVLSYYLPEFKDSLNLYSFGAPDSSDIKIPHFIAGKENLNYTPYILDQNYLDNHFIPNAEKTIILSNGTRNYKRTHYLYAIQQIAAISDILMTGIFGDEVFKVAQAVGGTVLSQNALNLLNNNFDIDRSIDDLTYSKILNILSADKFELIDEFRERLINIKNHMSKFESKSQQYYSLRFEFNLRKYFGNEVNSYNDFVYCFSPFIDFDFLGDFAKTSYLGTHFSFNSNSIKLKKMATHLYYQLTKINYAPLTKYNSSRGYSMKDSSTILGNARIFIKKYLSNKTKIDGFNTDSTDDIFQNNLFIKTANNLNELFTAYDIEKNLKNPDLVSLKYFVAYIEANYA